MKSILPLFTFLILSLTGFAGMEYTTIRDGAWDDPSVWSTDGTNPCNCFPSNSLSGTDVFINHTVTAMGTITLDAFSNMEVSSTGTLEAYNYVVDLVKGDINAVGDVKIKKLSISKFSSFSIYNAALMIQSRIEVGGFFTATFSNVYVELGNIDVLADGTFTAMDGTKVYFTKGNFENYGTTYFCETCCLQIYNGNIKNVDNGEFLGEGIAYSETGNISTDLTAVFSPDIRWCAAGNVFGLLASLEDCSASIDDCLFVPLSTGIVSFNAKQENAIILANWDVATESNITKYSVEYSYDGKNWELLTEKNKDPYSSENVHYSVEHKGYQNGVVYYRLRQYAENNQLKDERYTLIKTSVNETTVFPNPSEGTFNVAFNNPDEVELVSVLDLSGKVITEFTLNHNQSVLSIDNISTSGVYFLIVKKFNNDEEIMKLVKR